MLIPLAQAASTIASTEGIQALGVNMSALLFQIANFIVLFFILKRFAFRPILRVLEQRRAVIEEGLRTAQIMKEAREQLVREQAALLQETRRQAAVIAQQSRVQAEEIITSAQKQAATAAQSIIGQAQATVVQEMNIARRQLRQEAVQLVVLATEKILGEVVDLKADSRVIKRALMAAEEKL